VSIKKRGKPLFFYCKEKANTSLIFKFVLREQERGVDEIMHNAARV